jgi:hypothetical protein
MTDEIAWFHAERRLTLIELCEASGLPEASIRELIEYGALSPVAEDTFTAECVGTVRDAARLCAELDLELPSMALVVRFLARIHDLESEVRGLRARLPG